MARRTSWESSIKVRRGMKVVVSLKGCACALCTSFPFKHALCSRDPREPWLFWNPWMQMLSYGVTVMYCLLSNEEESTEGQVRQKSQCFCNLISKVTSHNFAIFCYKWVIRSSPQSRKENDLRLWVLGGEGVGWGAITGAILKVVYHTYDRKYSSNKLTFVWKGVHMTSTLFLPLYFYNFVI